MFIVTEYAALKACPANIFVQKILSAYKVCTALLLANLIMEANGINPDLGPYCLQHAPSKYKSSQ